MSEEIYIDLTNVPLKPIGKKEISQLEIALIIGTLYRPEVLELIRDPVERSTWIDSLAVAAAALARYKAGLTTSEIAEELGRSETTIRSHLNQKTKAGKLIAETYDKIKKGELKLVVPFIKAPVAGTEEELKALNAEIAKLREQIRALEQQVNELNQENTKLRTLLSEKDNELESIRRERENLIKEREELVKKKDMILEEIKKIKQTLLDTVASLDKLTTS
ncbi:MAG: transcriptional regulator [Desulfurococcaceae archaeon]|jgi:probable regulatory domain-containing protein